jgi:ABC-type glycerol-3-phosphate transport system substrate-binding protein
MSRLSKLWTTGIALLIVLALVAACAPQAAPTEAPAEEPAAEEPAAAEEVTIHWSCIPGIVADAVTAVADKYMEEHPNVEIIVDVQSAQDWQATAPSTMFPDPTGPDITWWWCSPGTQFDVMGANDVLVELDDLYEQNGWYDVYSKGTIEFYRNPNGHLYGVNTDTVWTPTVYYNVDIFEEVGIEPPTTWEEFYEISQKLRDAGYQPWVGDYDMAVRSHLWDGLMLRCLSEDEYYESLIAHRPGYTGDFKWDSPGGHCIFQTIKDMAEKGVFLDGYAGVSDTSESRGIFLEGKAAMFQDGSWSAGTTSLPTETEGKFEWDYFYYPLMDHPNYGDQGAWAANCVMVLKPGREHVDISLDIVTFLMEQENAYVWLEAMAAPPGRIDLDPERLEAIVGPQMAEMVAGLAEVGAPSLIEGMTPPAYSQLQKEVIDRVLHDQMTIEEAAQALDDVYAEIRAGE